MTPEVLICAKHFSGLNIISDDIPLKTLPRRFPLGAAANVPISPQVLPRVSAGMGISLEQAPKPQVPGAPTRSQGHYPELGLGLPLAQIKTFGVRKQ